MEEHEVIRIMGRFPDRIFAPEETPEVERRRTE